MRLGDREPASRHFLLRATVLGLLQVTYSFCQYIRE